MIVRRSIVGLNSLNCDRDCLSSGRFFVIEMHFHPFAVCSFNHECQSRHDREATVCWCAGLSRNFSLLHTLANAHAPKTHQQLHSKGKALVWTTPAPHGPNRIGAPLTEFILRLSTPQREVSSFSPQETSKASQGRRYARHTAFCRRRSRCERALSGRSNESGK